MEIITFIFSLLLLTLSIVMVVKFFQIASDVREISNLISLQSRKTELNDIPKSVDVDSGIRVGSHVIELKTKRQFKVMELVNENGIIKYICSFNNGITNESFRRIQIELFKSYYKK